MEVLAGFLLGFLGSLHCIGMCGPIALALPRGGSGKISIFFERLLYNIGRGVTYALIGLVFGLLGTGLRMFGIQQAVSVALGAVMIISVLLPRNVRDWFRAAFRVDKLNTSVTARFRPYFKKGGIMAYLAIGMLNGFLPCGFVYLALAGALALGTPLKSAAFMFLFGLGTLPLMLSVGFIAALGDFRRKFSIRRFIPAFTLLFGMLFLLRGLNLGIPFISPRYTEAQQHGGGALDAGKPATIPALQDSVRHPAGKVDCCGGE